MKYMSYMRPRWRDICYPSMIFLFLLVSSLISSASMVLFNPGVIYASTLSRSVSPPDLGITKAAEGGNIFQVGQKVTYDLVVQNGETSGPTTGEIKVTDAIPAGFTNLKATGNNWSITFDTTTSPATMTAIWTDKTPVESNITLDTINVTGTLTKKAATKLENTATVSTPGDSNAQNDSCSITIDVAPQPDLAITKSRFGGNEFTVGDTIKYQLTVQNLKGAGPTSGDITVTDQVPAGFSNLKASGSADWRVTIDHTTSPAIITALYKGTAPVEGGEKLAVITVRGRLTSSALSKGKSSGTLTNSATVDTPNDSNLFNNSDLNIIKVAATPVLSVFKSHRGGNIYFVGQHVTYFLRITVEKIGGPVVSDNPMTLLDPIAAGFVDVKASGKSWKVNVSVKNGRSTVTATYSGSYPIAPGIVLPELDITGRLTSAAQGNFRNVATVKGPFSRYKTPSSSTTIKVQQIPTLPPTGSDPRIGGNPF